jgi:hypothetical protein
VAVARCVGGYVHTDLELLKLRLTDIVLVVCHDVVELNFAVPEKSELETKVFEQVKFSLCM